MFIYGFIFIRFSDDWLLFFIEVVDDLLLLLLIVGLFYIQNGLSFFLEIYIRDYFVYACSSSKIISS